MGPSFYAAGADVPNDMAALGTHISTYARLKVLIGKFISQRRRTHGLF